MMIENHARELAKVRSGFLSTVVGHSRQPRVGSGDADVAEALIDGAMRFGSFVLDPADERLVGAHGPIHIGQKAYRVLRALIEHRGRLLTKDFLFNEVWADTIVSESSLTSVIKELRRALGDEAREPRFIESVYGRGYRFLAELSEDDSPRMTPRPDPLVVAAPGIGQRGEAPSLAVLPFKNRSGVADDEVFAEGMVEDVIAALSHGVNVMVLGSTVTAGLRLAPIGDIATVGRRLGVRYLLEGNVRRVGRQLRVTAQILEAANGVVRWSGRFDRPLGELAQLQEDLVTELADSLDVQLQSLELQRILKKPDDLTAWEALMRSNAIYQRLDAASLRRALEEAHRAVSIAPDYAAAHAQIALAASVAYLMTSPDDPAEERRIGALVDRALALEPEDPLVLSAVGCALNYIGRPEDARRHLLRAIAKAPAHGMAQYHLGVSCCLLDRHAEAIMHLDTAVRHFRGSLLHYLPIAWRAGALIRADRWDEAEADFDEVIALSPEFLLGQLQKAVCLARRGEEDAARRLFVSLQDRPDYSHDQCVTMLNRIMQGSRTGSIMLAGVRDLREQMRAAA